MSKTQVTDAIANQAIEWFARLRADDVSVEDRAGFVDWLRADRGHQIAIVEIINLWDDMTVVNKLNFAELREFDAVLETARQCFRDGKASGNAHTLVYSLGVSPA